MEHRLLGRSGLKVPVLSLGTATFGGTTDFFSRWGACGVNQATRMVDICIDHGANFFDSADIYDLGESERTLGQAVKGRRSRVLISTKATFATGTGPNDVGSSRYHIIRSCEASLQRLGTDHIDLYLMHGFDAMTPIDETLRALESLVTSGKVGYIGASNFSGWQLMKSLAESDGLGIPRYVVHQCFYSLVARDYEWELMPLGVDQGVCLMAWSPLGWGRLTGNIRRDASTNLGRIANGGAEGGPTIDNEHLFKVVDAIDVVSRDVGRSVPQVAINWLLTRPSVASVVIGARNEDQLLDNLGSVGWSLAPHHLDILEAASHRDAPYPYWHQRQFVARNSAIGR